MVFHEEVIAVVDIGTHSIKVVFVGVDQKTGAKVLLAASEVPTLGVRKGQIVDIIEVTRNVKEAFAESESKAGVTVHKTLALVGGTQTDLLASVGSIAVSRADSEVSKEDIERVLESARTVSLPQNKEVIHVIPLSFSLDGEGNIKDPLGMKGVRLEARVMLCLASSPALRAISKAAEEAGKKIEGFLPTSLAVSAAVLSKKQREAGAMVCDIGSATTSITIFKDGNIVGSGIVPVAGGNITHDIAIGLRTALDVAEKVKVLHGSATPSSVSKKEKVVLSDWGVGDLTISRFALCKIIETRVKELFSTVSALVQERWPDTPLPGGVVLVGGGADLSGTHTCARDSLKLPSEKGRVRAIGGDGEEIQNPAFASLLGAALILQVESTDDSFKAVKKGSGVQIDRLTNKIKEWVKEFMP